ncbi:MAG: Nucleotidyltransferase domain protein [Candidatus Methanofastidiosum methylothiophilum]|uniref:Nucleotidyltransferase domain protein n=1 Tax=Candidatus Methanofastidiosum methylothiophilum TaxID=1705564 RepID=A0A150IHL3_9EURY|nr:MAG: Nucleotidyltransferase domain protein [Candidatus Methanofastidiosum methylthiophilus]
MQRAYRLKMGKIKISDIKIKAVPVLKKHGIKKAAIFGSFVRGEDNKNSDIDFLVEFIDRDNKTLLDLIGLELDLEEIFNRKVDVITYNSIHPLLKEYILREQEVFYEEKS